MAEQGKRIDQLLEAALKRDASERAAFLTGACAGNDALREHVESLLESTAPSPAGSATDLAAAQPEKQDAAWLQQTADFASPTSYAEHSTLGGGAEQPPLGARIDRYLLLGKLGSGGMGLVYAAYDPELDRKVAIKLLRPGRQRPEEGRARLLREAQAMARLSHPNVIAVYQVGTYGEQVFMVMEHVEGCTLRHWLKEEARSVDQIASVFLQAGRGLAAAHAAGLLHRDFKPDNVLIGKDGRARVIDFGLVRAIADEVATTPLPVAWPSPDLAAASPLAATLTRSGTLMGTPAYMAPEQRLGLEADDRTDQFSFCVALYEALYCERPFAAPDLKALSEETLLRVREPPKSSRVPARLREAVLRGLQPEQVQRHPSMDALLEQLERKPRVARRRTAAAVVGLLLVSAAGLASWQLGYKRSQLCKGAERNLTGVWDDERRSSVARAFRILGKPYGEDAVNGAQRALDTYAQNWVKMHTDACEATRLRRTQSEELLDRRMACLSQRREELKTLTDLFARADAKLMAKAVDAAQSLSSLQGCADEKALLAPVPPPADPVTRAKVDEVWKKIAIAKAHQDAARYAEALPIAKAAAEQAKQLHYHPLEAQALTNLGSFQAETGDFKTGEQTLKDGLLAALAGGDDQILLNVWLNMVAFYVRRAQYDEAEDAAKHAYAVLERVGGKEESLAYLLNDIGMIHWARGKYAEAEDDFRRALELRKRVYGPANHHVAQSLTQLGASLGKQDKEEEALRVYQEAISIYEQTLGPRHPKIMFPLNNLGHMLRAQGKLKESRAYYERAIAVVEQAEGPDAMDMIPPLNGMGILLRLQGKFDEALVLLQRAADIRRRVGDAHPDMASMLESIGLVLRDQKKHDEALGYFKRALVIEEQTLGRQHPAVENNLAWTGQTYLDLAQPTKAIALLERALHMREARVASAKDLADARFVLARALYRVGRDRKRARSLALQARETYAIDRQKNAKPLAEIDSWLARKG